MTAATNTIYPGSWGSCNLCGASYYGSHVCPKLQPTYPALGTNIVYATQPISRAEYDALSDRVAELEAEVKRLRRPRPRS